MMEASVVGDIDTQQELGGVINVVFRFQDGKEVLERELSVRWVKQGRWRIKIDQVEKGMMFEWHGSE